MITTVIASLSARESVMCGLSHMGVDILKFYFVPFPSNCEFCVRFALGLRGMA